MKSADARISIAAAIALSVFPSANAQPPSPTPVPLAETGVLPNEQTSPPEAAEARPAITSSWSTPAQLVPVALVLGLLFYLWRRRAPRELPPSDD